MRWWFVSFVCIAPRKPNTQSCALRSAFTHNSRQATKSRLWVFKTVSCLWNHHVMVWEMYYNREQKNCSARTSNKTHKILCLNPLFVQDLDSSGTTSLKQSKFSIYSNKPGSKAQPLADKMQILKKYIFYLPCGFCCLVSSEAACSFYNLCLQFNQETLMVLQGTLYTLLAHNKLSLAGNCVSGCNSCLNTKTFFLY